LHQLDFISGGLIGNRDATFAYNSGHPQRKDHPLSPTTNGNGKARYQREKVRVAIIGVGNCASAFVQGVTTTRTPIRTPTYRV